MKASDFTVTINGVEVAPFDEIEEARPDVTLPIVLDSDADVALRKQEPTAPGELLRLHEQCALRVERVRRVVSDEMPGVAQWQFWGVWTT